MFQKRKNLVSELLGMIVILRLERHLSRAPLSDGHAWPNVETDSAGLNNDADVPLSPEQIEWANIIFVMEKTHRNKLSRRYRRHLKGKRVICLDIPDNYAFMDSDLIKLLEARAGRFLR